MSKQAATEGLLRVWWVKDLSGKPFRFYVDSPVEATKVLEVLAAYGIHHDVESNVGGLEVIRDGEWEEWESEDGESIDEWAPKGAVDSGTETSDRG